MGDSKRHLWLIFISIFINFFGMSIAISIFPSLILKTNSYLIDPTVLFSTRLWILMALMTMHPLGQLLASGLWGAFSDRYGRKKILLASFSGATVGFIAMGYAIFTANLPFLLLSRFFTGCMQGNLSVAQAVVTDVCSDEERSKFFGRLYACVSLAYVVGPWAAGQWVYMGGLTPMAFASAFWVMCGALIVAIMLLQSTKETHRNLGVGSASLRDVNIFKTLKTIVQSFGEKSMRIPFLVNAFIYFGIFSYFRFYTVHFIDTFDFSARMLSFIVGYSGLFTMLSQFFLLPLCARFFSSERILSFGAIALFAFMLGMCYVPSQWSFIYTLPFVGAAIGITLPLCSLVIAENTSRVSQGKHLGINHTLQVIAEITAGILGGYVATFSCTSAIAMGGAVAGAGGALLLRHIRLGAASKDIIEDEVAD